ncbi:MAG TPA: hypothetical protein VNO35_10620 [Steroidobacteraceae bacterium]|nr:hypothetical protein [Steroidobacteraceae bacterium]
MVEQLGALIADMSTGLAELRNARPRRFDPDIIAVFPDEFDRTVAKLEKHVHAGMGCERLRSSTTRLLCTKFKGSNLGGSCEADYALFVQHDFAGGARVLHKRSNT